MCLFRSGRMFQRYALLPRHAYKKRNGRSNACGPLDKQYVHVIYGGVIDVRLVPYWEQGAFVWMDALKWCAVRMLSVTPVESCLLR